MRRRGRPVCRPVFRRRNGPVPRRRGGNLPPGGSGAGMGDGRTHRSAPTGSCFPFRFVLFPPGREGRVLRGEGGVHFDGRGFLSICDERPHYVSACGKMKKHHQKSVVRCPFCAVIASSGFFFRNRKLATVNDLHLSEQIFNRLFIGFYRLLVEVNRCLGFLVAKLFPKQRCILDFFRFSVFQAPIEDGLDIFLVKV